MSEMNIGEMNIFQRMLIIEKELQTVAKNLTVETGRGKGYKAVSERDIIDAVKPLETKYGVYSYPASREIMESATLESESTYDGKVTKKTTFFTRIKTVYRFVNVDNPQDFIETVTFAEGIDPQDKGSGKAMTYADKYALMKAYKISTGDDPDQNASEETNYTTKRASSPDAFARSARSYDISPKCAICDEDISEREHDYSVRNWGKPLCRDCQKVTPRK